MAGSLKTEAIVLRSIRFGEADRVLHLYTPQRGRVSAIAKGVRRAKSRFGGRELLKAAERLSVDDDLRERHHARAGDELGAALRVLGQVDLLERDAAAVEQGLCRPAVAARFRGVDSDSIHYFTKDSAPCTGRNPPYPAAARPMSERHRAP